MRIGIRLHDTKKCPLAERLQIVKRQGFSCVHIALGKTDGLPKETEEQARVDERRNVLLQCIGASDDISPDMFFGDTKRNAVYMLSCDGFRHEISNEEIYAWFRPDRLTDVNVMNQSALDLINLNKQRQERDNITVALVRTF